MCIVLKAFILRKRYIFFHNVRLAVQEVRRRSAAGVDAGHAADQRHGLILALLSGCSLNWVIRPFLVYIVTGRRSVLESALTALLIMYILI